NEDFTITFSLQGSSVPANAYLVTNDLRLKLPRNSNGDFAYTFEKLQRPMEFQIEAAGFFTQPYKVKIFNRPERGQLKIALVRSNEGLTITFSLQGSSVPANAYLVTNDLRLKLPRNSGGDFAYTFEKLQRPIEFQIEAAGFFSQPYKVEIFNRPELGQLKIGLVYPRYLNLRNEQLINTG